MFFAERNSIVDGSFDAFLTRPVVLDTGGPIIYLGTLTTVSESGFLLEYADVHDTRVGHATAEVYINEARHNGICANRRRVFVMRSAVMSVSLLDDVIEETGE